MKQDRFLIGILIFIAILVIAALTIFFVRQDTTATYQPDDTPEGVVYNFALAIQSKDVERAYAYLADLENKPTETVFRQAILNGYIDTSASIQVGDVEMLGDNDAWVAVTIHYMSSGPFDSGWDSNENATLVRQAGLWKISFMPYPYWSYDWFQPTVEPVKP
jgi:hypothetical protein